MCNDYRLMVDVASIVEDFADLKIKSVSAKARRNLDRARTSNHRFGPIVRTLDGAPDEAELV